MLVGPFRITRAIAALAICVASALASVSRADNPIVQTLYTADPAPFVHEGTLYVFTGHDEDQLVNNFFTMNDWRVYSTQDMANWTDHGTPLSYKTFSWSNGDAWAGQVVGRDGKFYYYVPTNRNGVKVLGVAVSDTPVGPYKDALGKPLLTSSCGDIDPTVFIDDDGQAYLYWGNPRLCYVKLNADMVSYAGNVVQVPLTTDSFGARSNTDRTTSYEEGPWFYKREGHYYMVFAAGPISEHIGYSMSSSATGPWTYAGVIMPTEGASFTNHPGVADFKGKSFFFYHNGALPGGSGYHRSVCVEEFTYGADGKIPPLKMTKQGPTPVDTLNPFQRTEAETIAFSSGLKTEVCSDDGGGMNVTAISNGDYLKVENVDFRAGVTTFEARVSSSGSNAKIELRLDSAMGTLLGTCDVSNAQSWTTKSCPAMGASGKHDLFLKFSGGSGDLLKFNWWKFSGPDVPREPDAGTPPGVGVALGGGDAGATAADAGSSPLKDAGSSAPLGGASDASTPGSAHDSGMANPGDVGEDLDAAGGLLGTEKHDRSGCRAGRGSAGGHGWSSLGFLSLLFWWRSRRRRECSRTHAAQLC